jgi:hypothetical protein
MVGGKLDEITELRRLLGHRAWKVDDAADAVDVALRRFLSSSNEYVPPLPDHGGRGRELAGRCRDLGDRTGAAGDALAAADRWAGTTAAMWGRDAVWNIDAARAGLEGLWHSKGALAHVLRALLDHREPQHWTHAPYKRDVLKMEGRRIADGKSWANARRAARNQRNASWRATLGRHTAAHDVWVESLVPRIPDEIARLRGRLDTVVRPELAQRAAQEAASRWTRARNLVSNTRVGAVARVGGEVFGVVGTVYDGLELYRGIDNRDTEKIITSSLNLAAGAAMLFPPTAVIGAVVTGGVLVYEYREEIADAVAGGARAVGDIMQAATGALKGLF